MELLSAILSSPEFATFVIAAIVAVSGYVGKALVKLLKTNLTESQLRQLVIIAEQAVRVAEQTGIGATGEEKKAEAIRIAQTYLDALGIKVNATQLSASIEAAVYNEFTQFKTQEALPSESALTFGTASDE